MPRSASQITAHNARMDRFTQLLSEDLELNIIAQRMGIRTARASQLLMQVRKDLGWQAI
jgi:hypothetical protein